MARVNLKGTLYDVKKNKKGDIVIDKVENKWRMNLTKNSGVKTITEGVKSARAFAERYMDEKGRTRGNPPRPVKKKEKKK